MASNGSTVSPQKGIPVFLRLPGVSHLFFKIVEMITTFTLPLLLWHNCGRATNTFFGNYHGTPYQKGKISHKITRVSMILVICGHEFSHLFKKPCPLYFDRQMLEHDRQSLDVYAHASRLELKVWISLELLKSWILTGKKIIPENWRNCIS